MKKNDFEAKINTLIGKGSEVAGDFSANGSVRIDGKVDGDVNVKGALILGASGVINGDIVAEAVVIGGEVLGDINAKKRTELTETAKVIGDISTEVIVIDEHAIFQGGCNMNQEVPDKRSRAKNNKALKEGRKTAKAAIAEALKEVHEAEKNETQDAETSPAPAANPENAVNV